MKKMIALLLVLTVVLSVAAVIAYAKDESKVDARLTELVTAAEDSSGGLVVVITHRNPQYPIDGVTEEERIANNVAATSLLCEQIQAITYAEILRFDFNRLYVGLPYGAVSKVAELDTVESIAAYDESFTPEKTPEEKISSELQAVMEHAEPDTKVNLTVFLSYRPAVYYGFSEDDFADPQDYVAAKRKANADYHTALNQKHYDAIASKVQIELNYLSQYTPAIYVTASVSQIAALAQADEVNGLEYLSSDQTPEPTVLCEPTYLPEPGPHYEPSYCPETEPGDADMDGRITILDATYIQRWLAGLIPKDNISLFSADFNADSRITIMDATAIQRYLVGLPAYC